MISYEEVIQSLRKNMEFIPIKSLEDLSGLHAWLITEGHLTRDEAVVIVLEGATYIMYIDFPCTTLVVETPGTAAENDFPMIGTKYLYGSYTAPYTLMHFVSETFDDSWLAFIVIAVMSAVAVVFAPSKLDFLIDKSIDVAAISAAFLAVFLSFKAQPNRADELWFHKGVFRKHFRVDKYSLVLMTGSLVSMGALAVVSPILGSWCFGRLPTFLTLLASWYMLYAGFYVLVKYHLDQLESEGEKILADRIRDALKSRAKR